MVTGVQTCALPISKLACLACLRCSAVTASTGTCHILAAVAAWMSWPTRKASTILSSLQLRTSNASLAVGLARQTVFASERYEDLATKGNAKVPNYTSIVVLGEPKNATIDQLRAFYAAYNFEIVEGWIQHCQWDFHMWFWRCLYLLRWHLIRNQRQKYPLGQEYVCLGQAFLWLYL